MEVKDCMSKDACCCNPNTKVAEAAKLMADRHIGCIPVCDDQNCVVGLVTDRDILLRTVCCDKDTKTTPVSEIMSCEVCTCKADATIDEACKLMSDYQIRRIPVCDQNNKIVGVLSLGDLAHFDHEVGDEKVCNTLENICHCHENTKNAE